METKVPIAYVTKWSVSSGILVIRDGLVSEGDYLRKGGFLFVTPKHWTTNRDTAISRYEAELLKARKAAERKLAALDKRIARGPAFVEHA